MDRPAALDLIQERLDRAKDAAERARLEAIAGNLEAGWTIRRDALERMTVAMTPKASMQSWRECLYAVTADGATVTASGNSILVPDFNLPAGYLYPGRTMKYTLFGRMSSVITTPGTFTMALRWGGVAGVVLATSGAWAPDPTAASTNIAWWVEYYMVCRSVGTSGTAFTMGRMSLGDYDDASATTLAGNLNMTQFPDVPAVATIDTTILKALSPVVNPSLTTASITAHIAILEALT